MRRIKITVAYDGTGYSGWQKQPDRITIQSVLEEILSGIEKRPVTLYGSGRTDAGVHAHAQVAAFNLQNPIPTDNLRKAINRLLPLDIRVTSVTEVHANFHPRFDARAKTYQYTIYRPEICPPFQRRWVHHFPYPLHEAAMIEAAPLFEGEHDFGAFAAADERYRKGASTVRTIFSSRMWREDDQLVYRVRGSGFLKHMVRNMVGTLLEAGKGNLTPAGLLQLLGGEGICGATSPASGLFLVNVEYPEENETSNAIDDGHPRLDVAPDGADSGDGGNI